MGFVPWGLWWETYGSCWEFALEPDLELLSLLLHTDSSSKPCSRPVLKPTICLEYYTLGPRLTTVLGHPGITSHHWFGYTVCWSVNSKLISIIYICKFKNTNLEQLKTIKQQLNFFFNNALWPIHIHHLGGFLNTYLYVQLIVMHYIYFNVINLMNKIQ